MPGRLAKHSVHTCEGRDTTWAESYTRNSLLRALTLVSIVITALSAQQPTPLERLNVPSLSDLAKQAKAEGKTSLEFPPPAETPLICDGLDDYVDDSLVVTGTIRSSQAFPSGSYNNNVTTWYKLRLTGIVGGNRPLAPPRSTIPTELLPLLPGELLVAVSGGRLTIDGVEIISDSALTRQLIVGSSYLLFLDTRGLDTTATAIRGGRLGAYEMRGDTIRALSKESNPVATDIESRFHSSLLEVSRQIRALAINNKN